MKKLRERIVDFLWSPKQFSVTNLVLIFSLLLFIQSSVVSLHRVVSSSMEDTLLIGDVVLVARTWYGFRLPFTSKPIFRSRTIQPHDVVLFEYPFDTKQEFVKRCVAVGGDTVSIVRKTLSVNGNLIDPPATVKFADQDTIPSSQGKRDYLAPTVISSGTFFAMGDNRDFSSDSRLWGNVQEERIIGKPVLILWSAEPGAPLAGLFGPYRKGRTGKKVE